MVIKVIEDSSLTLDACSLLFLPFIEIKFEMICIHFSVGTFYIIAQDRNLFLIIAIFHTSESSPYRCLGFRDRGYVKPTTRRKT